MVNQEVMHSAGLHIVHLRAMVFNRAAINAIPSTIRLPPGSEHEVCIQWGFHLRSVNSRLRDLCQACFLVCLRQHRCLPLSFSLLPGLIQTRSQSVWPIAISTALHAPSALGLLQTSCPRAHGFLGEFLIHWQLPVCPPCSLFPLPRRVWFFSWFFSLGKLF